MRPATRHRLILSALLVAAAATAGADDVFFGPRLGYTHDSYLDQVHVGAHVTAANLSSNVRVTPSAELGFGDGRLLAVNGDVLYEFTELADGRWGYYGGGGPVLTRYTHGRFKSTDFALSLVLGVSHELRHGRALFGEVRLGLEDAPALKLTMGLNFY
jgi:hypothetical protein